MIRYERRSDIHEAFLHLAAALICFTSLLPRFQEHCWNAGVVAAWGLRKGGSVFQQLVLGCEQRGCSACGDADLGVDVLQVVLDRTL